MKVICFSISMVAGSFQSIGVGDHGATPAATAAEEGIAAAGIGGHGPAAPTDADDAPRLGVGSKEGTQASDEDADELQKPTVEVAAVHPLHAISMVVSSGLSSTTTGRGPESSAQLPGSPESWAQLPESAELQHWASVECSAARYPTHRSN